MLNGPRLIALSQHGSGATLLTILCIDLGLGTSPMAAGNEVSGTLLTTGNLYRLDLMEYGGIAIGGQPCLGGR